MAYESDIIYGSGINEVLACLSPYRECCVVVDANLRYGAADSLISQLEEEGRLVCLYVLEASEQRKTLSTVEDIVEDMLSAGVNRNALVISIGGGITSDIAGFAASIYKRGLPFALIPTTLLAQCDAAIGGKTGVNFRSYKNMLGVIRQPAFTFICPSFLRTLSPELLRAGAAEMLKTFIIGDAAAYAEAVRLLQTMSAPASALQLDFWSRLGALAARAAGIKADIVARDPYENGERRVLNLGHTFAHAIEALAASSSFPVSSASAASSSSPVSSASTACSSSLVSSASPASPSFPVTPLSISHGEAVAIGIVMAARLSDDRTLADRFRADFASIGLPTEPPFPPAMLAPAMHKDKKAESGSLHFVIPQGIGHCSIVEMSVEEAIKKIENR